ncbi:unnamed protein product, partial [Amoebophrya sp. A120]
GRSCTAQQVRKSATACNHVEHRLVIEITVNNYNGVRNSNLLKQYMTCPIARELALSVKRWAREKNLVRILY